MAAPQRVAGRVLIIDDEEPILATFRLCLEDAGYSVDTAAAAADGLRLAARQPFDVCLLDLSIGDDSGLEVMPRLKQLAPWLRVVVVSAHSAVDAAMDALRAGADDYLVKPCLPEQLRIAVMRQVEARKLTARVEQLEREVPKATPDLESMSPLMAHVIETARHVAATDANILLLGESGTGKGELAKAIHRWSNRSDGEFVTINCPSLSAELLESELFGHNKGSFTGATQSTVGRVTQADGGTLFLDEIGDFPLVLQPKLLRFIQDKEYERIGDPVTRRADVRIVAATNRDLENMVKAGAFRQDLLYRLNVITIELPPLRERPEDVPHLAAHFLARFAANYNRPARGFAPEALALIGNYTWPGNVRELQNVIERATILSPGDQIEPRHLAIGGSGNVEARQRVGTAISLDELEKLHIQQVLATSETLDQAAKTLGIDASTLYRKRKTYSIG
jgi:two-component system, NtrC family, response regulator AlgB